MGDRSSAFLCAWMQRIAARNTHLIAHLDALPLSSSANRWRPAGLPFRASDPRAFAGIRSCGAARPASSFTPTQPRRCAHICYPWQRLPIRSGFFDFLVVGLQGGSAAAMRCSTGAAGGSSLQACLSAHFPRAWRTRFALPPAYYSGIPSRSINRPAALPPRPPSAIPYMIVRLEPKDPPLRIHPVGMICRARQTCPSHTAIRRVAIMRGSGACVMQALSRYPSCASPQAPECLVPHPKQ